MAFDPETESRLGINAPYDYDEPVRRAARDAINGVSEQHVRPNNIPLQGLFPFRATSRSLRTTTMPVDDNLLGVDGGGDFNAVSDGDWVMLGPLRPGRHTRNFGGTVGDPTRPDFELDITYEVTVLPQTRTPR